MLCNSAIGPFNPSHAKRTYNKKIYVKAVYHTVASHAVPRKQIFESRNARAGKATDMLEAPVIYHCFTTPLNFRQ